MSPDTHRRTVVLIGLVALFVTSIVTAQLISSKLAVITLPFLGAVLYPTGTIAYAVTFLASDVVAECYGKRTARWMVNIGFLMNAVLLALVWVAIWAPNSGAGLPQAPFESVLGASTNVVVGSLVAYVISQNCDVSLFHRLRSHTGRDHLWLRNLASTATAQFVDTAIFTVLAFALLPAVTGVGQGMAAGLVVSTIVGQYVLKLGIALADTPLVYAARRVIERHAEAA